MKAKQQSSVPLGKRNQVPFWHVMARVLGSVFEGVKEGEEEEGLERVKEE